MSTDTNATSGLVRWSIRILAFAVVILGVAYGLRQFRHSPRSEPAEAVGPAFLNASAEVAYVGTEVCARCHQDRHASYLETTHSRSMSPADPSKEPIPAEYHHKPSDLRYRIWKDETSGRMRIQERVEFGGDKPYVLAEHEVDYLIGSGTHSRSYLVQIEGFLYEAPVTYFQQRGAWGISPGYDRTFHLGFARPTGPVCLSCHVGNVERIDGTMNKVKFHEDAIGCERCHGPGELHAEFRSGVEAPAGEHDLTIIDPKIMSRTQKLDMCAQCHMDHTLTVNNPGKEALDWRPGMRWTDVMVTYRPKQMWQGMTVVGHVDQMRQSKCFQQSEMTCNTCHNPHESPPEDPVARAGYFNKSCLQCHDHCGRQPDDGPGIVPPEGDNCVKCHMPTSDTDIVHIAFHHHRIGIHGLEWSPEGDAPPSAVPVLEPLGDISHLPRRVRDRNLGIAYIQFAGRQPWPGKQFFALRGRAQQLLEEAHAAGQRDAELEAVLARLHFDDRHPRRAEAHALAALGLLRKEGGLSAERHCDVLLILGAMYLRRGELDKARGYLEQLGAMRRDVQDVLERMDIARREGKSDELADLARLALQILPNNPDVHYQAAEAFGTVGDDVAKDLHNAVGRHLQIQLSKGQQHLVNGGDENPKPPR